MLEEGKLYCVLRFGPHYFIMSKCKAVKHVKTYLSPVDVESFVRVCLEYPSADLASAALYGVTEVVEGYSLKGKWVMSWASSAKNDFLVTLCIREISGSAPFLIRLTSFVLLTRISFVEYLAGGD